MFARNSANMAILNRDQSSFIVDYIDSINDAVTKAGYTFGNHRSHLHLRFH